MECLNPQNGLYRNEILLAMEGINPSHEHPSKDIGFQLSAFTHTCTDRESADLVFRKYKKEDAIDHHFRLYPFIYKESRHFEVSGGYCHMDGQYGIMVTTQIDNEDIPLVVSSFSWGDAIHKTCSHIPERMIQNEGMVIQQLQTSKWFFPWMQRDALSIIHTYRWEKALVHLELDLFHRLHIPVVYIQPGPYSWWQDVRDHVQTSKVRYEVTAERMGFEKNDAGLWQCFLSYPEEVEGIAL